MNHELGTLILTTHVQGEREGEGLGEVGVEGLAGNAHVEVFASEGPQSERTAWLRHVTRLRGPHT